MNQQHDIDRLNAADSEAWIARMRRGDFEGAWALSDRIRERSAGSLDPTIPRHQQQIWDGTPLAGRRVLVRCYHGLGDTIQFIRYVPLLRRTAREIIVWAQAELIPLLATVEGIDVLLPLHDGAPDVAYDVDIEVMELPQAFRTSLATIPAVVPYLSATPAVLPQGGRPRVAIFWRAGDWDWRRTVAWELIADLLRVDGVSWFTCMPGQPPEAAQAGLVALPPGIQRTAQLIQACDLVISVDTMTAHLAGALARPTWTLLPRHADWRWMEGRDDTPWYPTMRLFRQPAPGDWASVIGDVRSRLTAWRPQRPAGRDQRAD